METIFIAHDIWDVVELGVQSQQIPEEEKVSREEGSEAEQVPVEAPTISREDRIKNAKALSLIQGAISDELFPRIRNEKTAKGAWDILRREFRGDKKVRAVKLQAVRADFEYMKMTDSENLDDYLGRFFGIVNNLKLLGEDVSEQRIVQKLLMSLIYDKNEDLHDEGDKITGTERVAKCANEEGVTTGTMFYACHSASIVQDKSVWFVDSACSNHMTSQESLLLNLDRSVTCKVKIGTGDLVQAIGKGTLVVNTKHGKRYINEVLLVPRLDENLLSVGQMMEHGYYVLFGGNMAVIFDDSNLENVVANVVIAGNRCFPLPLESINPVARRASIG
ncbi:uncharacterized protein [Malus domestica]|uniref:uncharacterized protein n=1 Tax=Malus domestica TaxID=3750 RepID=UPI003974ABFF